MAADWRPPPFSQFDEGADSVTPVMVMMVVVMPPAMMVVVMMTPPPATVVMVVMPPAAMVVISDERHVRVFVGGQRRLGRLVRVECPQQDEGIGNRIEQFRI